MMAAEERMIGFATTNTGGPSVTAPGGAARVVGNNPLSYALPGGGGVPDRFGYGVRGSGVGQDSDDEYVRAAGAARSGSWAGTGETVTDPSEGHLMMPAGGRRGTGWRWLWASWRGLWSGSDGVPRLK